MSNCPTILIAEDDSAMAAAMRFMLIKAGYRVVLAADGQEAWQCLQSEAIDLLVTDQAMPNMVGTELCAAIAADPRLCGLPVILVTAKAMELDDRQLHEAHLRADAIISKPFSPRNLVSKVGEMLPGVAGAS